MNAHRLPALVAFSSLTAILIAMIAFISLTSLSGCASNPSNGAGQDNSKAIKKISMAIGVETSEFAIVKQQASDAPTGYDGIEYTVKTTSGRTYKCEILEPSGVGKIATLGMASGADAMCTDFTPGGKDKGRADKPVCNALLKAAGKC